ncbi:ead/Ea22-like family protein [Escherichia coli]
MESNIKWLVAAGHEMASELKAECGAVDMRSVAKLISDLATQLEVQLVRANALAEDQQKAIESIKQADAAVKLAHEKFSALAAENAGIKSAIPESRDIEDDNDNMDDVSLAEDFGFNHAIERMRRQIPETPTTDAFLAEVRAQGVDAAIEAAKNLVAQG